MGGRRIFLCVSLLKMVVGDIKKTLLKSEHWYTVHNEALNNSQRNCIDMYFLLRVKYSKLIWRKSQLTHLRIKRLSLVCRSHWLCCLSSPHLSFWLCNILSVHYSWAHCCLRPSLLRLIIFWLCTIKAQGYFSEML